MPYWLASVVTTNGLSGSGSFKTSCERCKLGSVKYRVMKQQEKELLAHQRLEWKKREFKAQNSISFAASNSPQIAADPNQMQVDPSTLIRPWSGNAVEGRSKLLSAFMSTSNMVGEGAHMTEGSESTTGKDEGTNRKGGKRGKRRKRRKRRRKLKDDVSLSTGTQRGSSEGEGTSTADDGGENRIASRKAVNAPIPGRDHALMSTLYKSSTRRRGKISRGPDGHLVLQDTDGSDDDEDDDDDGEKGGQGDEDDGEDGGSDDDEDEIERVEGDGGLWTPMDWSGVGSRDRWVDATGDKFIPAGSVREDTLSGEIAYRKKCLELKVVPLSRVLGQINSQVANLSHCALGRRNGAALAWCLRVNRLVRSLDLEDNNLDEHCARMFVVALARNHTVTDLDVSRNPIGPRGAKTIATLLDCSFTWTQSSTPATTTGLSPDLVELLTDLEASLAFSSGGKEYVAESKEGPRSRRAIGSLQRTRSAKSQRRVVTPRDTVFGLPHRPWLRRLVLCKCEIEDEGTVAIAAALSGGSQTLQELELWGNRIGDLGGCAMGEMLRTNRTLQILDLSWNMLKESVYMAKLAEQAERYDEMVDPVKKVAKLDVETEGNKGSEQNVKRIQEYRHEVEQELSSIGNDILNVIDENLIPSSDTGESKVFYFKMKGDCYRYVAEFKSGNERKEAAENSLIAYTSASEIANGRSCPHASHSSWIGAELLGVFFYEILNSPERDCHLLKQAFDEAIAELDTLSEESYKDSTLIMQLLRDNLTLWASDLQDDGGDDVPKGDDGTTAEEAEGEDH
ncbi:hypothetical protein CBR_g26075 [Chara braunii]|uniref:14-3-3 domain-containing protein n=1 Tax=Chara braunii TaxID=69332 RepID=A0A388JVS9_CHABU|nr:hypothetical protein CBR_g26075 [Chara braunii]|eukprot:GBG61911.1 hypothetical protein CBR_g26075 [Chara braunii]